jgi:hypothetical protein
VLAFQFRLKIEGNVILTVLCEARILTGFYHQLPFSWFRKDTKIGENRTSLSPTFPTSAGKGTRYLSQALGLPEPQGK